MFLEEDSEAHHDLKAVADAEDQSVFASKGFDGIGKMNAKLRCQNASGSDVVAVAEPAGETENLKIVSEDWSFDKLLNVDRNRLGPGQLERVGCFNIAIRSRGTEDENARLCHVGMLLQ
jgi:hypothetical protein